MDVYDSQNRHIESRFDSLLGMVYEWYPAERYEGPITPVDDQLGPDLDEEEVLYKALKGRKWTDISAEFVHNHPRELVFLTDQAFAAFVPAWLIRSLEDPDSENLVRDYLVFSFSPGNDRIPDTTLSTINRLRSLLAPQRRTLRCFMAEFAQRDSSAFIRRHAAQAVRLIDEVDEQSGSVDVQRNPARQFGS